METADHGNGNDSPPRTVQVTASIKSTVSRCREMAQAVVDSVGEIQMVQSRNEKYLSSVRTGACENSQKQADSTGCTAPIEGGEITVISRSCRL